MTNEADKPKMENQNHTDPTDADVIDALFGYTPDTVEEKAAQINLALSANDPVMAASAVFDQARDCRVPKTEHDPGADDVFPYPDLAPFGNQGLVQFMEALGHLGMQLAVKPIDA